MNLQWTHHLQLLERWEKRSKNCTKCWAKQSNDCSLRGEKTKKEEVSLSAEAGLPNIGCYFYSLSKMQKRKARNQASQKKQCRVKKCAEALFYGKKSILTSLKVLFVHHVTVFSPVRVKLEASLRSKFIFVIHPQPVMCVCLPCAATSGTLPLQICSFMETYWYN